MKPKTRVCRNCGSIAVVTQTRDTLDVKSNPIKETEVECLACKRKYTE